MISPFIMLMLNELSNLVLGFHLKEGDEQTSSSILVSILNN